MKFLKKFNENSTEDTNQTLINIVDSLQMKANITDVIFGNSISPYVHFNKDGVPFSISLTDKRGFSGDDFTTVSIIVEVDGITDSLGAFDIDDTSLIVDVVLNTNLPDIGSKKFEAISSKDRTSKKDTREEIKELETKIKETNDIIEDYRRRIEEAEEQIKNCERRIGLWSGDIREYKKDLKKRK